MQRSHTLATSVGSVFTLKRWMWQSPNNSSDDNESKSSGRCGDVVNYFDAYNPKPAKANVQ